MKTLVVSPVSYSSPGFVSFINVVFLKCVSSSNGGAIYLGHSSFSMSVEKCLFNQCGTSQYGGAMCIKCAYSINVIETCFSGCFSNRCNAFLIWGNGNFVGSAQMNYTDDYSPSVQLHSSCFLANNIIFCNNNITKSTTSSYAGGIYFGNKFDTECIKYSQISHTYSSSFIGFTMLVNALSPCIDSFNFLNNTLVSQVSAPGWIEFRYYACYPAFVSCVFHGNTKTRLYYAINTGSGYATFNQCKFDREYESSFAAVAPESSNTFNVRDSIINIDLYNTLQCWLNESTETKNIQHQHISLMFFVFPLYSA